MNAGTRGRPRSYDPDKALQAALAVFWRQGYCGTSLDDLRIATGMNRPSLRAAFGDKKAIYLAALKLFQERMADVACAALSRASSPEAALAQLYCRSLEVYASDGGLGCMVVGTSSVGAPDDEDFRAALSTVLSDIDQALERWLQSLKASGQLLSAADSKHLAWHAAAVLHSLGARARSGESVVKLRRMAAKSARLVLQSSLADGAGLDR